MAPDITTLSPAGPSQAPEPSNGMPPPTSSSRRTSQIMGPPAVPASANPTSPNHRSPVPYTYEAAGVPLRHPRPLTAAELYLECEKEQEAVVNRLTRELTALRAQSASVASNASHSSVSTSASLLPVDISDPNPTHQLTGATHPTPSRRQRSSSSLSARATQPQAQPQAQPTNTHGGNISQASADRAAAAVGTSRQPSASPSGTSTPARQSLDIPRPSHIQGTLYTLPHRPSLSRDVSYASQTAQVGSPLPQQLPSPLPSPNHSINSAMQHYAETAAYRSEMEIVKAENEALRQRVRALERALRTRRRDSSQSDAAYSSDPAFRPTRDHMSPEVLRPTSINPPGVVSWAMGDGGVGGVAGPRERSESQSTSASSRRAVGVVEDELHVGESAGNAGFLRGP